MLQHNLHLYTHVNYITS